MDSGLYECAGEAIAALSLAAEVSASPFNVRGVIRHQIFKSDRQLNRWK